MNPEDKDLDYLDEEYVKDNDYDDFTDETNYDTFETDYLE
jgi:hypothetical protein